jgi:hypothetical protein
MVLAKNIASFAPAATAVAWNAIAAAECAAIAMGASVFKHRGENRCLI